MQSVDFFDFDDIWDPPVIGVIPFSWVINMDHGVYTWCKVLGGRDQYKGNAVFMKLFLKNIFEYRVGYGGVSNTTTEYIRIIPGGKRIFSYSQEDTCTSLN